MYYKSLATLLVATSLATPAFAWDYNQYGTGQQIGDSATGIQNNNKAISGSSSTSRSSSISGSASYSQGGNAVARGGRGGTSNVTVNNNTSPNGSGDGSYGYGGNHGGWNGEPVASAVAPSFYNGANPCLGAGASAAGQAPMFGLSFGGQQMDVSCQALRLGEPEVAREVLCIDSSEYRKARWNVGSPCAQDRKRYEGELAESRKNSMVVSASAPASPIKKVDRPKWCNSANPSTDASREYVKQICG